MGFVVIKPGAQTCLQDLGRTGHRRLGVGSSGVMDPLAATLANGLVGNDVHQAVIEVVLAGPEIEAKALSLVAVVGASLGYEAPQSSQFPVYINGIPVAMGEAHALNPGDRISVGPARFGARCWIAFSGESQDPKVLGSRSTHVKTQLGGHWGRALKAGDLLPWVQPKAPLQYLANRLGNNSDLTPTIGLSFTGDNLARTALQLPLLPGPQAERLAPEALEVLYSQRYRLSQQCDRMGYRLEGPVLQYQEGLKPDLLSEPNAIGAVQLPGDGQPLILMQDAGTTGGYGKVGVVPTAFLRQLAQLMPGTALSFVKMSIEEAQMILQKQHLALMAAHERLLAYRAPEGRALTLNVSGRRYQVFVFEE